jgi:hypothetical protein
VSCLGEGEGEKNVSRKVVGGYTLGDVYESLYCLCMHTEISLHVRLVVFNLLSALECCGVGFLIGNFYKAEEKNIKHKS